MYVIVGIAFMIAILFAVTAGRVREDTMPGEVASDFGATPDAPRAFGYKTAWLAIKTRDTGKVVRALQLEQLSPANWRDGIATIYDDELSQHTVFVTPPVSGWTFVIGLALPYPMGRRFEDRCTPLLLKLGRKFSDVQFYFTYPPIDFYAWARVLDGRLQRAFAWGDEGVIWNKGKVTAQEREFGLKILDIRAVQDAADTDLLSDVMVFPSEDHVVGLAGKWSIDPTDLENAKAALGIGLLGKMRTRPQMRLKKPA